MTTLEFRGASFATDRGRLLVVDATTVADIVAQGHTEASAEAFIALYRAAMARMTPKAAP